MLKPAPLVGGGKTASSSDKNPKILIDLPQGSRGGLSRGHGLVHPWAVGRTKEMGLFKR